MHQASVGFHCPECTKQGKQKVYQGMGSLRVRPVLTQILIVVNVAVFMVGVAMDGSNALGNGSSQMQFDYGLIAKFAKGGFVYPGLGVGEGEWYRIVTSGFMHAGMFHLAVNMYALWILGRAVESLGGRLRFGVIYGVSLASGALGALLLTPGSLTVGASGAIFGLMGAVFLAQRAQGIPFRESPLLAVLLINLVITFGLGGISIGGHLGGLAGGAFAGWILFDYGLRPGVDKRLPLAACGAVAGVCLVAAVVFATGWLPA